MNDRYLVMTRLRCFYLIELLFTSIQKSSVSKSRELFVTEDFFL